ncbi:RagB/SusD family nutrient uptake outer membrane protein [Halalkalibaculum sp. DA3122]|uniref:RagB/SusD family nutrient uptake outer membrane protein n=1 Tax=Halalkalibaculum sp. DA3122 TaxID=3373607 RepID=UPI00375488FC
MKSVETNIFQTAIILLSVSFLIQGCEDVLNEPVHSELASENLLTTKSGLESTLFEGYTESANMSSWGSQHTIKREEMTTDILWHTGGGENQNAVLLINFTWDPNCCDEASFYWDPHWSAIRNANIVLDNLDRPQNISESEREKIGAEARFVRAIAYYDLWNQYGGVPLRTSTEDPLELARASAEETINFVISEFSAVESILPGPNEATRYRANSGAARAFLTKLYLNTEQWQQSADKAQEIIDNGNYELYPDYNEMFALENEQNSEFIWVRPAITNDPDARCTITATAFPWGFHEGLDGGIAGVVDQGWTNFASQYRLRDSFYNSFAPNDERNGRILTRYINTEGDTVDLIEDYDNATRSMKYPPDPNATGGNHGNDIPKIRYADILLSRAEALNEINGPNQESIDLINQIRERAGLGDVQLSDFANKEELNDQILKERKWEFWYESKRRRDLIRHGEFIESAQQRGATNAQEFHKKFPIPQYAIDANPELEQNPGY